MPGDEAPNSELSEEKARSSLHSGVGKLRPTKDLAQSSQRRHRNTSPSLLSAPHDRPSWHLTLPRPPPCRPRVERMSLETHPRHAGTETCWETGDDKRVAAVTDTTMTIGLRDRSPCQVLPSLTFLWAVNPFDELLKTVSCPPPASERHTIVPVTFIEWLQDPTEHREPRTSHPGARTQLKCLGDICLIFTEAPTRSLLSLSVERLPPPPTGLSQVLAPPQSRAQMQIQA